MFPQLTFLIILDNREELKSPQQCSNSCFSPNVSNLYLTIAIFIIVLSLSFLIVNNVGEGLKKKVSDTREGFNYNLFVLF